MLAFFDFYPIITKADTFLNLYMEALSWALWNFWNVFLFLLSLILSKFIVRNISFNTLSWTFFLSVSALFILGVGEFLFREQLGLLRGAGKLSDQLLFITQSVMILWLILIPLLLTFIIFNKPIHATSALSIGARFRSLTKWRQRILLTLFAPSLFSYAFLYFPVLILAFFGLSYVWIKNVKIIPVQQKRNWSDLLPIGIIALGMLLISQVKVEALVHSIPFFKQYFN